jgi:hypothetical protein
MAVASEAAIIHNVSEALDLMAKAYYSNVEAIILSAHHFASEFYDLRSGLAGEILQKFSNYTMKLAIVGQFEKFGSKNLQAFIAECNRGQQVFFVPDRETAVASLTK